jgi:hypothetical protein
MGVRNARLAKAKSPPLIIAFFMVPPQKNPQGGSNGGKLRCQSTSSKRPGFPNLVFSKFHLRSATDRKN